MAEPRFAGGSAAKQQQAVNRLRELNLERVAIAIPQIAVVGNQSLAGSASLSPPRWPLALT
jgi:hypothetical protein